MHKWSAGQANRRAILYPQPPSGIGQRSRLRQMKRTCLRQVKRHCRRTGMTTAAEQLLLHGWALHP